MRLFKHKDVDEKQKITAQDKYDLLSETSLSNISDEDIVWVIGYLRSLGVASQMIDYSTSIFEEISMYQREQILRKMK